MMGEFKIPIANIYYLFCYAWNRFEEAEQLAVGAEQCPDLPNLLAKVLLSGARALLHRGLDRGYQLIQEDIATVRGRIDLNGTIQLKAKHAPRLSCAFDELSHDVPHNQIIKASMVRLARSPSLDDTLAHELRQMARHFGDVADIRFTALDFARVRLHRNNAYYDLMLKVCRLAYDLMLPDPSGQGFQFQSVLRDERKMAAVFEEFVRNFYRTEQREFRVKPLQLEWDAIPLTASSVGRLPTMRTDIYLEANHRRIIIDTKYYAEALQSHHGSASFHSGNLYQLFAYLKNDAARVPDLPFAEGMLLYPKTGEPLDGQFQIQGHKVRIVTVDLSRPWREIDVHLKGLLA
jgi:5-methylcytosine-specific restriction enzyme subunit McrC